MTFAMEQGAVVFRAMKADGNERPVLGACRRTLGVKVGLPPGGDILVQADGRVLPQSGGLSVAPKDPRDLPVHRRPPEFGGHGRDPVFLFRVEMLPNSLILRHDKPFHALIEPQSATLFEDYQTAIHQTQLQWEMFHV